VHIVDVLGQLLNQPIHADFSSMYISEAIRIDSVQNVK
jgi:hypothetical protein